MKIEDFSYIRCTNCKNIIILPIPYKNSGAVLTNICYNYNELNECCTNTNSLYGTVTYGIEKGHIKLSDLPLKLRKEFPPEITHKFECGKHSLVVTKHNGDKVTISVNSNNVTITDNYATTVVYVMDD